MLQCFVSFHVCLWISKEIYLIYLIGDIVSIFRGSGGSKSFTWGGKGLAGCSFCLGGMVWQCNVIFINHNYKNITQMFYITDLQEKIDSSHDNN